jgi:hypothetical protein
VVNADQPSLFDVVVEPEPRPMEPMVDIPPIDDTTPAMFDMGPPIIDVSRLVVRRINTFTAARWFADHHYLANIGTAQVGTFGVYGGDLVAVVNVGNPGNVHGVAEKYGLTEWKGNKEITRVAVHPDAPTNTTSRAIAMVCRVLARDGWEWLFSYADTSQGHHGGIYQALNAVYVGISEGRAGYLMDGKPMHPRTLVSTYGTQAWPRIRDIVAATGHTLEKVEDLNADKHTYIVVIASEQRVRFRIRNALEPYRQPYPKRNMP